MPTFTWRITVAVLAFSAGIALNQIVNQSSLVERSLTYVMRSSGIIGVKKTEAPSKQTMFDPSLPTEITFQRVNTWCEGRCHRTIILRTKGGSDFEDADVNLIDLQAGHDRHGKLPPYYYRYLITLIESQGYFDMANQYAMGWIDTEVVTSSVRIGDQYKCITTANESEVPSTLWGIHYAIEGVVSHVKWDIDK